MVKSKFPSIDECHYTYESGVVYAYVHFRQQIAYDDLCEYLVSLKETCGITLIELVRLDNEHPGFNILLRHYRMRHSAFTACTDGTPGVRRGMLRHFDSLATLRQVARQRRLAGFLRTMEVDLSNYKQRAEMAKRQLKEYEAMVARRDETIRIQRALIDQLKPFQSTYYLLRSRIRGLDRETQRAMLAPDDDPIY